MKGREEKREEERAGNERLALLRARGIMALVALLFLFQAGLFIYNKFFDAVYKLRNNYYHYKSNDKQHCSVNKQNGKSPPMFF